MNPGLIRLFFYTTIESIIDFVLSTTNIWSTKVFPSVYFLIFLWSIVFAIGVGIFVGLDLFANCFSCLSWYMGSI